MDIEFKDFLENTQAAMFYYLREKLRAKKLDKSSDEYLFVTNFLDDTESDIKKHIKAQ